VTGATYRNLTLSVPLIAAIALFGLSMPLTLEQLAMIPVYFVAFNLMEYLLHRGPMHHAGTPLFDHTRIHHRAFHFRHLYITKDTDNFSVVTPLYVCGLVAGMTAIPALILGWHWGAFIVGCSMAYYFVEEILHYAAHTRRLGQFGNHHRMHHRMMTCNYNINFPLCDWIFGTRRT
jgi:hypothetical protein